MCVCVCVCVYSRIEYEPKLAKAKEQSNFFLSKLLVYEALSKALLYSRIEYEPKPAKKQKQKISSLERTSLAPLVTRAGFFFLTGSHVVIESKSLVYLWCAPPS